MLANLNKLSFQLCISQSCQQLHLSSSINARPAKVMKKILNQNSNRKKRFYEVPLLPTANALKNNSSENKIVGNPRRASVLNKIFMRYITDIMANGENATEFLGKGIEINRVQICPDYKGINVFWIAKGNETDNTIEDILKRNAGYLRHELSTLRVMGVVPKIQFVKDKQYAQILEVDSRLARADFGEDHVPVELSTKLKTHLELFTPISPIHKDKIQELDEMAEEEFLEVDLPEMPQDVFGLNHANILKRVMKGIKPRIGKTIEEHSILDSNISTNAIIYPDNKSKREAFNDFLKKRELMRSQARKAKKDVDVQEFNDINNEDEDYYDYSNKKDDLDFIIEEFESEFNK